MDELDDGVDSGGPIVACGGGALTAEGNGAKGFVGDTRILAALKLVDIGGLGCLPESGDN